MSKVPYIERPFDWDTGLTGECAYLWALFLANEADMVDDYITYDIFKGIAEQLAPKEGRAIPTAVHIQKLEEAIEKYDVRSTQHGVS